MQPAEWLAHWIRDKRDMCAGLQDCVQKYKLGLGGERVDKLVIAEIARLRPECFMCKRTEPHGEWLEGTAHTAATPRRFCGQQCLVNYAMGYDMT